jgi:hypothetical protein
MNTATYYNGENRETLLTQLRAEYERRTGLILEEVEDAEAWLWEMATSDWSAKDVVDYIIDRYGLLDFDKGY